MTKRELMYPKKSHPGESNSNWRGGKSSHPLFYIYHDMRSRCHNPNHKRYQDYGGRGISVCKEWREDFWKFIEDMGPRPEGKTASGKAAWSLDRIDNNGNYERNNCRWATWQQQNLNKSSSGESKRDRDLSNGRYLSKEIING